MKKPHITDEVRRFACQLQRAEELSVQQKRTLLGQAAAGDIEGARRGLQGLKEAHKRQEEART